MLSNKLVNYSYSPHYNKKQIVYAIVRPQTKEHLSEYLSIPFCNRRTMFTSNALVAFESADMAKQIITTSLPPNEVATQVKLELEDLINLADLVRMPVILINNIYCDCLATHDDENLHYEIQYYDENHIGLSAHLMAH